MKLIKFLSAILIFLSPVAIHAGTVIVPFIHHYSHGRGSGNPKMVLGLYLAANIFMLTFYLCRSIRWYFSRTVDTFFEYVIWSDLKYFSVDVVAIFFGSINGFALLIFTGTLISNAL